MSGEGEQVIKAPLFSRSRKVNHEDNVGKKFGRLLVQSFSSEGKYAKYECTCDCGNHFSTYAQSIIKGLTQSCGCFYKESRSFKKKRPRSDIKHGEHSSVANSIYCFYKRNAAMRGLELAIDRSKFYQLIIGNCFYCGIEPVQVKKPTKGKKSPAIKFNGIDRIDNNKGYTLDNCKTCCYICNRAKGQMNVDDFYYWLDNLVKFRGKKT